MLACKQCFLSGTCRTRHRVPSGVRFAPSLRDRLRRPLGTLVQETATGNQPAGIHAGMLIADPSPSGGSLRSRRCFVPAHFCPQNSVGGRNGRLALSGSGFAALVFVPPPPRRGTGRVKGERYRGVRGNAPVGRNAAATALPCLMPPPHRWQLDSDRRDPKPHTDASDR